MRMVSFMEFVEWCLVRCSSFMMLGLLMVRGEATNYEPSTAPTARGCLGTCPLSHRHVATSLAASCSREHRRRPGVNRFGSGLERSILVLADLR